MWPPTQQRTCLWPSWLRNDVKRSGNRSGRWFVRPFRQLRPPPCSGGRPARGRPGAMTPKIARFLAEQQPATPCLVLDVDRVEANFRALQRALPLARIYYAVKANPARPVLERLVGLGSSFDAASYRGGRRLPRCRRARPRRSASATPSRRPRRSARAFQRGVTLFAFDSAEELEKLATQCAGRAGLLPHPGGERGRRLAAVAQVRHHGGERAGADAARRRDGAGSVRPVVPCRQPADHDARLRGGDRQGRDAVHRPDRGRRQPAHDEPGRRLPDALSRRRCRRSTSSATRS